MEDKINICILVLTNTLQPDGASRIRPLKIINEFKQHHKKVDVYFLKQGQRKTKLILSILFNKVKYNMCYIEPHTFPLSIKERIIIALLKYKGTWLSYFYRDMYWKYNIGKDQMSYFKWNYIYYKQKVNLKFINNYIDHIFCPSFSFINELNQRIKEKSSPLPPAGNIIKVNYRPQDREGVIYAGGISKEYGIDILLESFYELNKKNHIRLTLACREIEYNSVNNVYVKKYSDEKWLKVIHPQHSELSEIYNKSRIAILPKKISDYQQISLSFKIFEYASHGIPSFVSNNYEQAKLIETNDIGINIGSNVNDYINVIEKNYNNFIRLKKLSDNALSYIKTVGNWNSRYNTIIDQYNNDKK